MNNMDKIQRIIKKAVEELEKDQPDLSYLRGMLESLVDDSPVVTSTAPVTLQATQQNDTVDEVAILDAKAKAALKTIQSITPNE